MKYVMHNPTTKVTVRCTEKYLVQWMLRGFSPLAIERDKPVEEHKMDVPKKPEANAGI